MRLVSACGHIGERNILSCGAIISEPGGSIVIGNDCNLGCTFVCETRAAKIHIGNRVFIGGSSLISAESIVVEDDVFIAWGVTIIDHNSHSLYFSDRQKDQTWLPDKRDQNKDWTLVKKAPITIGVRSWIGFNSTILKGVTIGHDAVVAAGSVVTKSVEPFAIVGGNPAQIIGSSAR